MSIQAMGWVLEHSQSEGSDRLVLLAIANHANSSGELAYPSAAMLAAEARVDRRTVFRCIHRLSAIGELDVARGGGRGKTNSYRLNGVTTPPLVSETVTSDPVKGDISSRNGDSCVTQNRFNRPEPKTAGARRQNSDNLPPPKIASPRRCVTCDELEFDCLCGRGPLIQGIGR